MNSWSFIAVFVTICAFASAGHYHHDGHGHGGDGGVAVHYSVVTEHKGGHGGGHVGGHASVHTWGHEDDGGHGGDDGGHYGGHDGGHYGGHDGGHYGGHDGGHYGGHGGGHDDGHDHYAHPKYEFSYGVKDPKTGDIKSQKESRDGGNVKGSYTVKEADGTTRHVEYSADKHKGFNAVVHTLGHAHGGHDAKHGYGGGHDDGHHGHGKASSFILVKKQEEKKH